MGRVARACIVGVVAWAVLIAGHGDVRAAKDAGTDAGPAAADTAKPAPAPQKRPHLNVAVAGSKPFVVENAGVLQGLSIDVWKAVAVRLKVTYSLKRYEHVSDAIKAVASGKMDLAIGPISITAKRSQIVDFTQPYYTASAGILAQSTPSSAWKRFKPLVSKVFVFGFLIMVVILFGVGNFMWLTERRANPEHFPQTYGPGVLAGMWFALVTMTTVGYGDKSPKTAGGKAIASVWMLIGVLAMSSITAGIATALTLSQIQTAGISDMSSLNRRSVVVVKGTPGESLAIRYRAKTEPVKSKEEALSMVSNGQVDAMIYDYPVLKYYLHENPRLKLVAIQTTILSDNYGFAAVRKSPLVPKMNLALLKLRESGQVREIASRWLVLK